MYFYYKNLQINNIQIVDKRKCHNVRIRLLIPAQEAQVTIPLSPTLGQFGLNCQDFCKKFNEESRVYFPGTLLTVYLNVLNDRKCNFLIKKLHFACLLKTIDNGTRKLLSGVELYRLIIIFTELYGNSFWSNARIITGTIRASLIKIAL